MTTNRRLLVVASVVVVLLVITAGVAFGVRLLLQSVTATSSTAQVCTADGYRLEPDQAAVASTMVGVVITRGLPERASVLVLAAALQESKLRNLALGDGDRDSVGVLQQRPSQGWGTAQQINDLHYATGKFLDQLVKQPNWQTAPLAETIQAVQISADGSLYAQHEGEAQALADAFTGVTPVGISCTFPTPAKIAPVDQVAASVSADLPVNPPAVDAVHRSVTIGGAGWATSAWFVANAEQLGIESVSYAQRTWTASKGWRTDTAASSDSVTAVLHKTK